MKANYLFIDRDGTLLREPKDEQVDSLEKLQFMTNVFSVLSKLQDMGYRLIIVTNQDGLGTANFPTDAFNLVHDKMIEIFNSQNITFDAVKICPHTPQDKCTCRKPAATLISEYLDDEIIDRKNSYVIGDRETDMQLAQNIGVRGLLIGSESYPDWSAIFDAIVHRPTSQTIKRVTTETEIIGRLFLSSTHKHDRYGIQTGLKMFDHLLEQLVKHSGMQLDLSVKGDLEVDEHHTIEDTAIALGAAVRSLLGDKRGIARFGFSLPMDEASATVLLDLSGRPFCIFEGKFGREYLGDVPTEMIKHFFHSFAMSLGTTLHITCKGENTHHIVEACFKAVGRALRMALKKVDNELPTTKGVLI